MSWLQRVQASAASLAGGILTPGCFRPGESVVCALTGNGLKDADTVFRVLKEPPWIEAAVLAVENGIKEIL